MRLLITGGSGFLGKRTAAHFRSLGWQIFAPSHRELDITEETALREWFRRNAPQGVIHTAAVSDTGLCQQKPQWSETINVTGTVNLAKICREFGAKLVICSSDQVYYGSSLPGPHGEREPLTPENVYGDQKLRAEQQCLEILPETVCLRLSWMYAREQLPGDRGNFLTALKGALEDENRPLAWPVHDRRGITDAEEVVKRLPDALTLEGSVWNFGSENDCSTYDTVRAVLEALGMESALERLQPNEEAFAGHPRDLSMNLCKLNAAGISFPTTRESLCYALASDRI